MRATSTMMSTTITMITTPMSAATAPTPLMLAFAFRMDLAGARMAPVVRACQVRLFQGELAMAALTTGRRYFAWIEPAKREDPKLQIFFNQDS